MARLPDHLLHCGACGSVVYKFAGECPKCGYMWPVFGGWLWRRFAAMRAPLPRSKYAPPLVPITPPLNKPKGRRLRRRRGGR